MTAVSNHFINRLSPKTRLTACLGSAVCFSLMQRIIPVCAGLCTAIIVLILCSRMTKRFLRQLIMLNGILLLLVAGMFPIWDIVNYWRDLSWTSLDWSSVILPIIRGNTIFLFFYLLTADMDTSALGNALVQLHLPQKLVFLVVFCMHAIRFIKTEWQKTLTAALLRGFAPNTSLRTYLIYGNLFATTLLKCIDYSHRLYEAMLLRGFNGRFLLLEQQCRTEKNRLAAVMFCIAPVCLLCMEGGLVFYG